MFKNVELLLVIVGRGSVYFLGEKNAKNENQHYDCVYP
jgi:hypothetical protein